MKTIKKLIALALVACTLAQNAVAETYKSEQTTKTTITKKATKQKKSPGLVPVRVGNDMRKVGRIFITVKSDRHTTKRVSIWGVIQRKAIMVASAGVNKICVYTVKKDPQDRFVYKLELAPDGMNHRLKVEDGEMAYTFEAPDGMDQTVRIPGVRQVLVDGQWKDARAE